MILSIGMLLGISLKTETVSIEFVLTALCQPHMLTGQTGANPNVESFIKYDQNYL